MNTLFCALTRFAAYLALGIGTIAPAVALPMQMEAPVWAGDARSAHFIGSVEANSMDGCCVNADCVAPALLQNYLCDSRFSSTRMAAAFGIASWFGICRSLGASHSIVQDRSAGKTARASPAAGPVKLSILFSRFQT